MFFFLPGYRYLGDGGTDRREILLDGSCRHSRTGDLLLFREAVPPGNPPNLNFGQLTVNSV